MKKAGCIFLAVIVFTGLCHAQDQKGISDLLVMARQGDTRAMCDLGIMYFYGRQTLKDPFKAKCWVKKAHDAGSVRAKNIWNDLKLWQYSGTCTGSFDDHVLPRYSTGDVFTEPETGMTFVYFSKGCFVMGCGKGAERCSKDEKPGHRVCLDGFWISVCEVSQRVWKNIMGTNPSFFTGDLDLPVESVSFDDVQGFISKLNSTIKDRVALPTEAQWEYACRNGGADTVYPWGDEKTAGVANCGTCNPGKRLEKTSTCGRFGMGKAGLFDMGGNVKEWCRDVYDKKAYETHSNINPVHEEKGASRVVRGGSFSDNMSKLGCRSRDKAIPALKSSRIGFRLMLETKASAY